MAVRPSPLVSTLPDAPPDNRLTQHRAPLHALTGLRFFAAMWVVLFHTRIAQVLSEHGVKPLASIVRHGNLAVSAFFLLSGFILAYTYRNKLKRGSDNRRFWEARFARIWPLYAFSLFFSSLATRTFPSLGLSIATLCMVQAWNPLHPEYAGAWNFVCWSLSTEAFFYLCFPLVQRWLDRCSVRQLGIWLLVCTAISIGCNVSPKTLGTPLYAGIFQWIPFPIIRFPEFLMGVSIGNLFLLRKQSVQPRFSLATWLGLCGFLVVLTTRLAEWPSLILLPFLALLWGLAGESSWFARLLASRILIYGGVISYGIYLLQLPIKLWIRIACLQLGITSEQLMFFSMPFVLLIVSCMTYTLVEEPSRKALRAFFARKEEKA